MKAKILKMTGLTEAEFYKKYPTKEAFEMAFSGPKKFDLGGIVSGASSGASMGSSLGPWGAIAGAVIGGAASQIKDVRQGNAELAGYDKQVSSSKLAYGGELPSYGKGGGIHINPANKGKFTATKKATGKTTEELTHSKNPLTRKRAIFAQNAAKWKHAYGGEVGKDANTPPSMSFDRNMPTTASLQTVMQNYRPADAYAAGGIMPDYKVGGLLEHALGSNFYAHGGEVKVSAGGQKHVIYKKESPTGNGKGVEGHIMVNHPSMDNGKWDTIDLTEKANAKTVAQGVAATKKWHEENPDAYAMGGYANGGMIKRADGSYSKRGLWDNIRANKGSGKKPTAEMLKQEAKIKAQEKAMGGYMYADGGKLPKDILKSRLESHMSSDEATNYLNKYAKGGYLNGGNMTEYIGAGGTHEENPNEGVNIGDKGLVEEKEVKYNYKDETGDNSYIFSNRLGFAPKAKRIMKKFDVRDNDKLSVEAKQQRLDMLKDKQEVVRTKMGYKGKFDNQMPMAAFGGGLNKYYGGGEFGEDISNPYVAENAPLQPMDFTLQKENEINIPLNKTSGINMKSLGAPQFPVNTPNPQMKDINGNFVRENAPTAMKSLSTPQIPTTDLPRARMKDSKGNWVRETTPPPMKRLGMEIPLTPKTPTIPNKLKTVDPGKFTTIEGKSKPAPKKDFGTKLANFGQFAGSLAKFATSLQGGDPVNLERMQDARISSKPAEISAANELNQVYNAANTDIRNQAGSNAGSYLASRIASAGAQADKTGAVMGDIRSKYDQMNLQSGLTTGQFNALTQQKEEDLRTQERDRARTLGIEAAGQAGQTLGNIKKSENEEIAQNRMIDAMSTQNWNWATDPTGKMQMVSTGPKSFGGYIKGYGGFMYKSKKKK